jgi:3-deoxy-D-manno-octulosonic acid kinase
VFSVDAPAPGPEGKKRWVVRHYHRGGAVGPILGDRYLSLGRFRPLCETVASLEARERGIPTPAVVAGIIYPAGIFYRADLVTEEIPASVDLSQVLFGATPSGIDPEAALIATGGIVRSLEQNGLYHPDLNAKNIVLTSTDEGVDAYLVDLDRCCARPRGVPAPAFPMRRRLARSLRKFEASTGSTLSPSAWIALSSRYSEDG